MQAFSSRQVPAEPRPALAAAARDQRVGILLCTYQGQAHLAAQLDSIAAQTHANWRVWASDDGSSDGTLGILDAFATRWPQGQLAVREGPRAGTARNFLHLTCLDAVGDDCAYFAYADQDDVWEADKLERAIAQLATVPAGVPALYCSRTRLVDETGADIGLSPLFEKPPSFANALVQNIGGGNTMVFNHAALKLLQSAGDSVPAAFHDWWAYLLVIGSGGVVLYDSYPSLRYRQHPRNQLGTNATFVSKMRRVRALWNGRFRRWNDGNVTALREARALLTPENRVLLERFARARDLPLLPRMLHLSRCGLYRQTALGNLGLVAAALLKKI